MPPSISFAYDALNRADNRVDGVGTTAYTYTSSGFLETEDGPFASDTVTNLYVNRLRIGLGLQQPTGDWTSGPQHASSNHLVLRAPWDLVR